MGKSKKAWKNLVDEKLDDVVLDNTPAVKGLSNDTLFFVDVKGQLGGHSDIKRKRQKTTENKEEEKTSSASSSELSSPSSSSSSSSSATTASSSSSSSSSSSTTSSTSTALVVSSTALVPSSGTLVQSTTARMKKKRAGWLAAKAANLQFDKERKNNLSKGGMQFAPDALTDIWAEASPEYGLELEKQRNKGFEVDITPPEIRKRVFLRPRPAGEVMHSKELVDNSGLKVSHPGTSYNPDEDQRQEILEQAYIRDEKERAEEARLKIKLNPPSFVVEDAVPSDDDGSALLPAKKQPKAKSKTQKNVKLRLKQEAFNREKEKQQQQIHKQIDRLGSVISEIKHEEKKLIVRKQKLEQLKQNPDHRPKLSKHEFVEQFPEIPLEDELKDRSMRCVTPCSTLITDRFKSLQERNIIETTVRVKRTGPRYKPKQYTRKSHRDPNMTWATKPNKA